MIGRVQVDRRVIVHCHYRKNRGMSLKKTLKLYQKIREMSKKNVYKRRVRLKCANIPLAVLSPPGS